MNHTNSLRIEYQPQVAFVSTYPPTACGLATFTHDLVTSVEKQGWRALVVSADHQEQSLPEDPRVIYQIRREEIEDYIEATEILNASSVSVVCLQHEYGIFGGEMGTHLLYFMDALRVPVVTTLHTVVPQPSPVMRNIMREVVCRSDAVVVMAHTAVELLRNVYGVAVDHVYVIPHGTPAPLSIQRGHAKAQIGLENQTVLSTFGLVSRGKGIEDAIRAMPAIVEKFPDTYYLVLGETHPKVRAHEGESYREFLKEEARRLGVQDHVRFVGHYLSLNEIQRYLRATDIYITPYHNPDQITSGTLAYAVAAGCAVVSTPYLYAKELLSDGGGMLAEFRNPGSIARAAITLLSDPDRLQFHKAVSAQKGAKMGWEQVGRNYAQLFRQFGRPTPIQLTATPELLKEAAS